MYEDWCRSWDGGHESSLVRTSCWGRRTAKQVGPPTLGGPVEECLPALEQYRQRWKPRMETVDARWRPKSQDRVEH